MEYRIATAELAAHDIQLGDLLGILEVKLDASSFRYNLDKRELSVGKVNAVITVTEAQLNPALRAALTQRNGGDGDQLTFSDIDLALMDGVLRVTGRVAFKRWLARVPHVPFTCTARLQVESGTHLHVEPESLTAVGFSVPAAATRALATRLNAALAERLNTALLPFPTRITSVKVEPGRLVLTAETSLRIGPQSEELVVASPGNTV